MKHVKFHLNRFLRRVRIHGGEFDTSARAMYRDEVVYPLQAELRIVRSSTIERKQMSTKTTFKRIALVTVAALGFGVMSVVPSTATINADSLTLSAATAAQTTAETGTATSASVTLAFLGTGGADSASVTASLVSGPSGSTALPFLSLLETSSATIDSTTTTAKLVGSITASNTAALVWASGSGTKAASAKFRVFVGTDSMTAPSVVGTYVVKITPATVGSSGALQGATAQTLTITVTAAPALDPVATTATSIITTAADTTSATDVAVTAIKSASTAVERAIIKVSPKNAAAVAATESYTALIKSGPGLLAPLTNKTNFSSIDATGRVVLVASTDWVAVYSDGAAGVTTIEIQSKAGVVLATETLTFYGTATSAKASVLVPVIAASGATNAILVNIYDGTTEIKDATNFYINSSATTVVTGAYTLAAGTYDATEGGFVIPVSPGLAGTANITVTTNSSATVTTGVTAAAVALRVGGTTLDDVKVAFDKSSYLPGELAVITVTPVDSAGLVLSSTNTADTYTVFATGGIVAPVAITGATITGAAAHDAGVAGAGLGTDGVATYKIYMPAYQGTFVFKYTTGTMATTAKSAVARTVSVDVIAADGGAAAAAAEEATAAANDATDAALSAAEAAEAATAMAQEAVDAVAELSAQVTALISALRAQITSLTNLVIKIQKKVKA